MSSHIRRSHFCLLLIPFAPACAPEMSPARYTNEVLDIMQTNALHRDSIAWPRVREQALARARGAKTSFETYPAIAYALTQLNEHHSFLQLPDSLPEERKKAIHLEMWKGLTRPQPDRKASPFSPSSEMEGHLDGWNGKIFARVVVPQCIMPHAESGKNAPGLQDFAEKLHRIVMDLQVRKPDGWIIDLRGNGGGNMWPMLAGIGAVLGEGDLGKFVNPDLSQTSWFYRAGKAGTRWGTGQQSISASIDREPFALSPLPPVAVLFDRGTASSGESVAVSFAGRPRERSFGEHTAGFTTANMPFPLSDGAVLYLSTSVVADRTGKVYGDGIDPDMLIPEPDTRPAAGQDAAIRVAEDWLAQQGDR